MEVLKPAYERIGIDAEYFVNTYKGVVEFEGNINWKLFKEKDRASYFENCSGASHIHKVTVPTFIYFTEDDPIVNR